MHNGMTLARIQGQDQGHRDPNAQAEVDRQSPYGTNFWYIVPKNRQTHKYVLPPATAVGLGS